MEVFGHFVFPRFSGFFRAFPFVYRLFRAFLFTIHFRHFVLPPIQSSEQKCQRKTNQNPFHLSFRKISKYQKKKQHIKRNPVPCIRNGQPKTIPLRAACLINENQ